MTYLPHRVVADSLSSKFVLFRQLQLHTHTHIKAEAGEFLRIAKNMQMFQDKLMCRELLYVVVGIIGHFSTFAASNIDNVVQHCHIHLRIIFFAPLPLYSLVFDPVPKTMGKLHPYI